MNRFFFAILLIFGITSCNQSIKEKTYEVKEITSPTADSCSVPYLFTDKNGTVYLSWIEKINSKSTLKFSSLSENTWSPPISIDTGSNWFVNWADYPVLISDGNKNLFAHYLQKSASGTFAYDVKYKTSPDNGATWSDQKILHDDGKEAEHGFVSIKPYGDKFFVSWLDGRNTVPEEPGMHEGHQGEMSLRGAILSKDGVKEKEWDLDNRVCDCCQTDVAITSNGPIAIYRDRSETEIRDISIVRFVNDQWTAPKTIYADEWKISGCPVNGPRADAIDNNLVITWFTMKENKGQVKMIFSKDGGNTFGTPIQIDEGNPLGRVDVVLLDEKTAMVSWMEGPDIKAVMVHANGSKESSMTIAPSSNSRSSGFPQMTKSGKKLFFAWTDDKEKTIKLATISL